MLNNVNVLEILSKWNSWDRTSVESGVPRQITGEISNYLDSPEVIVLKGVRRSGKSTIIPGHECPDVKGHFIQKHPLR